MSGGYLQDRNAVVAELLDFLIPTSTLEGLGIAPGVIIEGVEVRADRVLTAVHVVGHFIAVRFDIGSAISDGNFAQLASVQVRLNITSDGLNERSAVGCGIIVDDLITGEEEQCVGIGSKLLNGGEDALEVDLVVRNLRRSTIDRVLWSVDIEGKVDTSISKGVHAGVVIGSVVHGVDTNGIDTQLLEFGDVALAASLVGNGILCVRCAT